MSDISDSSSGIFKRDDSLGFEIIQEGLMEKTTLPELPSIPLGLDMPDTLSLEPLEWIIITPDNAEEVWAKLGEDPKGEVVLFALNEKGYEELAKNYASIRTALAEHRNVIIAYRDYYEPITVEELPAK